MMKSIYKLLIILLAVGLSSSCEEAVNPDGTLGIKPVVNIQEGGTFFNFFEIEAGSPENAKINFVVEDMIGPFATADLEVSYYDFSEDTTYGPVLFETISSVPQTYDLTVEDVVAKFSNVDLSMVEPLSQFNFSWKLTTVEGKTYENFSPDLNIGESNNSFTPVFAVACPSDIPEGEYAGVSVGFGLETNKDVTVTAEGGGIYSVSDISAGMLGALISNSNYDGGGTFEDICNAIRVPEFSPPGLVPVSQSPASLGSYDPETGVIVINWQIVGTSVTTTLTPK